MIQFAIYAYEGGPLIADYSHKIEGAKIASNKRGFAEATGFIPMSAQDAFRFYDRAGLPHVVFGDSSSGAIYEGRLEDVALSDGGVNVTAYGYARAMSDFPYSALWSDTSVAGWRPVLPSEIATADPTRFTYDTNNRVYIAAQKNATYANAGANQKVGYMMYQAPDRSSRLITGISFEMVFDGPANWRMSCQTFDAAFTFVATLATATSIGAADQRAYNFVLGTPVPNIMFAWFYAAAAAVFPNETGTCYLSVTNIRVVTSTANRVNTTLTANTAIGTNLTANVVSTAGMYVGQRLTMGVFEGVTVLSIGSATQFNATFTLLHFTADAVQGHVIYADEIVEDMGTTVAAVNTTQFNASTALVQSPGRDLADQIFIDADRTQIMDYLVTLGDTQTTPRQWEWGVYANQLLYFRPQGSAARTWYIDVSALEVQRTIDALFNSVYPIYEDAAGRRLRGNALTDAPSIARYGVLRQKVLPVQSTSVTYAAFLAAAALADSKDPKPRSGVTIDTVYDATGARWPLYAVRAGDTMVIRNLPPTLSAAIDRIRVFRTTRVEYDVIADTLTIEPESALPSLDALLAVALGPQTVNVLTPGILYGHANPNAP